VELVGPDALSDVERAVLFVGRMIREDFLQQSAYDETDRYSPLEKTYLMLKNIMEFRRLSSEALKASVTLGTIREFPEVNEIERMKAIPPEQAGERLQSLLTDIRDRFSELKE
jgi:V/A-type H+-transporting ATPase subunit A